MTAIQPSAGVTARERDALKRLAEFILNRTGIKLSASKQTYLEGRIRQRLHQFGFDTLDQYCCWLFDEGGMEEEEFSLIDIATTNKTEFFRELHHFEFLATQALPLLTGAGCGRYAPLRIWSAGCSNGAEPYSLAMLCQDFACSTPGFHFEILASDICTHVLREAVRAIYPHPDIEPVPMAMRQRYLLRDTDRNEVRIAAELRRTVRFLHHNLMEMSCPHRQPMDIIFCRNLLIYFDKVTQKKVLSHLCQCVKPGGYLILGHSESIAGMDLPLRSVAPTTFLRTDIP